MTENKNTELELQKSLGQGKTVIGIDIGFSSVNVAQSAMYQGKPTIIKIFVENIGTVADEERKKATMKALKSALAHFNTQNADVVCIVSNQKTIVDHVTMPIMPASDFNDAIKIEVNNSERFAVEDPVFDFQVAGRVTDKDIERMSVMVAVVARSSIVSLLSYFKPLEQNQFAYLMKLLKAQDFMGLNLIKVIPNSIAIENVIKKSKSKIQETIVVLEMGSIAAELNIYRNGRLEFSRKINITGLDFTRCLTSALSTNAGKVELTLEEAEWVKKEFGIPSASEEYLIKGKMTANQAISLLRPKLEQLIKEITRSFDFYYDKNHTGRIDKLVLLGGGTMIKRLPEFLNAELGLPVGLGNPLQDVELLYEGMLDDLEDKQRITLAIGASLSDAKGINLLPDQYRDSKTKFFQKLVMGAAAIGLVLLSIFLYMLLQGELNGIKQDSVKLENEYQSLKPSIQGVEDKLLIQKYANHRLDMGGLFKEFTYLSDNVYLLNLELDNGNFSLSGVVLAQARDSRRILRPLIAQLKKTSLHSVKIPTVEEDTRNNHRSNFTIEAKSKS